VCRLLGQACVQAGRAGICASRLFVGQIWRLLVWKICGCLLGIYTGCLLDIACSDLHCQDKPRQQLLILLEHSYREVLDALVATKALEQRERIPFRLLARVEVDLASRMYQMVIRVDLANRPNGNREAR
jgi:hypothetical protein